MPTLTNLSVNLTGNSSKLNKALKKARRNIGDFSAKLAKLGLIGVGVGTVLGGLALRSIVKWTKEASKSIDVTAKQAKAYGLTETEIKSLGLAAELGGSNLKTLLKAMQRGTDNAREFALGITESKGLNQAFIDAGISAESMARKLGDVERGGSAALGTLANPLKFLGQSADELVESTKGGLFEKKTLAQIVGGGKQIKSGLLPSFTKLFQVIEGIKDPVKRLTAIQEVFGKRNVELSPTMRTLVEDLEDLKRFTEFWRGSTSDMSSEVERMNDEILKSETAFNLFKERLVAGFATPIADAVEDLRLFIKEFIDSRGGMDTFANQIRDSVVASFIELRDTIRDVREQWDKLKSAAGFLAEGGRAVGRGAGALMGGATGGQALDILAGRTSDKTLKKQDEIRQAVDKQTQELKAALRAQGFGEGALGQFGS